MESFKIEHFKKDNPSEKFPEFSSLTSSQAKSIRIKLSERLAIHSGEPEILTKEIDKVEADVKGDDANDNQFELSTVSSNLDVQPRATVYINWYHYDQIDEMKFADLNHTGVYSPPLGA